VITESGVRVYKRWQDNVVILPGDESDPDLLRKAKELFDRGRAKGLPRIASENSEDALMWSVFSVLRRHGRDGKWLPELWARAFDCPFPLAPSRSLEDVRVAFWRGREDPLEKGGDLFGPPPDRPKPEGETEVDVVVTAGRELLLFIEAKLHSEVSRQTKHDPARNQVLRSLDVGSWYANKHGFASFAFALVTSHRGRASADAKVINTARSIASLRKALWYRTDMRRQDWMLMATRVGWSQWADVVKIATRRTPHY
jgi:hypothetical protein